MRAKLNAVKRDKNFWKKLSRQFNEYAAQDDWKNERSLKVSHTSLFPVHNVGRGPNPGEATLLEFGTKLSEARAIHFHYEARYGSVEVYLANKGDSILDTFFEVRKNGKNLDFVYRSRINTKDQFNYTLKEILNNAEAQGRTLYNADSLREELVLQGYSIVAEFGFSQQIKFRMPHHGGGFIRPTYVKQTRNAIEIGWISSGTYNSIPQVLRIECVRSIKSVSLKDLGIETNVMDWKQ